ncbi:hypothetical protein MVEN_01140700 [Mycena venus]|uniref:Uncharacterized protein n=1 Tax=Mycena venus TaxID=2733690 RepID=A0A8H6Y5D5_9AGAR|nr:hypothetical protein MVEN_01140700 [Mycena venus]
MPPRIDYSALPPLEEIVGRSINGLKKPELLSLAKELGLVLPDKPAKITGDKLKSDVSQAIETSTDPRFNRFRPAAKGGAPSKTSADKDKQDVDAAAQKQDVAPSGAHGKLFRQDIKSDPAPQFKRLKMSDPKAADSESDDAKTQKEINSSSLSEMSSREEEKDMPNKPSSKITANPPSSHTLLQKEDKEAGFAIAVEFQGLGSTVYIPPTLRKTIPLFKAEDGTIATSLKDLIRGSDPTDRYSKLSIETEDMGTIGLGMVADFKAGKFPEFLDLSQANMCKLECRFQSETLLFHVLWRQGKPPGINLGPSSQIKPLDLAKARPKKKVGGKKQFIPAGDSDEEGDRLDNEKDVGFLDFLKALIGNPKGGYNGETIGGRLQRWKDRNAAIEYCDENCKTGKPYRVPAEVKDHENTAYQQYANRPFTKMDITAALKIVGGTVTADKQLFTSSDLFYSPTAQMWVDRDASLDPQVKAQFDKMTSTKWKTYLSDAKKEKLEEKAAETAAREKRVRERKHRAGSKDKVRGQKRHRAPDSEEERAAERRLEKIRETRKAQEAGGESSLKKAKGKAIDSEELDTDNSSGSEF